MTNVSLAKEVSTYHKKNINIVGVPGAGKTQLVSEIAELNSSVKVLYFSFGRENTKNAFRRMPRNVECYSFHAFAKNHFKIPSSRIVDKITLSTINKSLVEINCPLNSAKMLEAFAVMNQVFCSSSIMLNQLHSLQEKYKKSFPALSKEEKEVLFHTYKSYWLNVWNERFLHLPVTHDMYLKAFALNAPKINYEILFVDEVQDLNDAMFSVVNMLSAANPELRVIKLGDPCQQIFGFRGASNQFINENFDFRLTKSKRFGASIAQLVNKFMDAQDLNYYTPIEGGNFASSIPSYQSINDVANDIKKGRRPTFISRYNVTLWYALTVFAEAGINCTINGNEKKELNFLRELYHLHEGRKSNHPSLRGISFERFSQNAKLHHDHNALLSCKFVKKISHSKEANSLFDRINKHLVSPQNASVMLTTTHQAKGLEFNDLIMMDDFIDVKGKDGGFVSIEKEEAHVIYTAMTRAKNNLTLPRSWTTKK